MGGGWAKEDRTSPSLRKQSCEDASPRHQQQQQSHNTPPICLSNNSEGSRRHLQTSFSSCSTSAESHRPGITATLSSADQGGQSSSSGGPFVHSFRRGSSASASSPIGDGPPLPAAGLSGSAFAQANSSSSMCSTSTSSSASSSSPVQHHRAALRSYVVTPPTNPSRLMRAGKHHRNSGGSRISTARSVQSGSPNYSTQSSSSQPGDHTPFSASLPQLPGSPHDGSFPDHQPQQPRRSQHQHTASIGSNNSSFVPSRCTVVVERAAVPCRLPNVSPTSERPSTGGSVSVSGHSGCSAGGSSSSRGVGGHSPIPPSLLPHTSTYSRRMAYGPATSAALHGAPVIISDDDDDDDSSDFSLKSLDEPHDEEADVGFTSLLNKLSRTRNSASVLSNITEPTSPTNALHFGSPFMYHDSLLLRSNSGGDYHSSNAYPRRRKSSNRSSILAANGGAQGSSSSFGGGIGNGMDARSQLLECRIDERVLTSSFSLISNNGGVGRGSYSHLANDAEVKQTTTATSHWERGGCHHINNSSSNNITNTNSSIVGSSTTGTSGKPPYIVSSKILVPLGGSIGGVNGMGCELPSPPILTPQQVGPLNTDDSLFHDSVSLTPLPISLTGTFVDGNNCSNTGGSGSTASGGHLMMSGSPLAPGDAKAAAAGAAAAVRSSSSSARPPSVESSSSARGAVSSPFEDHILELQQIMLLREKEREAERERRRTWFRLSKDLRSSARDGVLLEKVQSSGRHRRRTGVSFFPNELTSWEQLSTHAELHQQQQERPPSAANASSSSPEVRGRRRRSQTHHSTTTTAKLHPRWGPGLTEGIPASTIPIIDATKKFRDQVLFSATESLSSYSLLRVNDGSSSSSGAEDTTPSLAKASGGVTKSQRVVVIAER